MDDTRKKKYWWVPGGVEGVLQLHNVGVLQLFEQGDLSDGCARDSLILGIQANALKCNNISIVSIT